MSSATIHIIEDEKSIRAFLRVSLENAGYRVTESTNSQQGLLHTAESPPDLILLDLGLPDEDGQNLLRRLREWYVGPIIVLSARDQESEKVQALDAGANDYVTKPFGMGELLARVRTALRFHQLSPDPQATLCIGDLKFDFASRLVWLNGNEIHFTPLEYRLLTTLLKNRGKVMTHRQLLKEVWGPQATQEHHYLRVFVASLRRKIETDITAPRYLLTEQGVGYRFAAD